MAASAGLGKVQNWTGWLAGWISPELVVERLQGGRIGRALASWAPLAGVHCVCVYWMYCGPLQYHSHQPSQDFLITVNDLGISNHRCVLTVCWCEVGSNTMWSVGNPGLSDSQYRQRAAAWTEAALALQHDDRTHDTNNRNVGFYINNLTTVASYYTNFIIPDRSPQQCIMHPNVMKKMYKKNPFFFIPN